MVTDGAVSDTRRPKTDRAMGHCHDDSLGNYIMPVLFGLLGSIAYVLRRHYDRLGKNLLSPSDLRSNSIRLRSAW